MSKYELIYNNVSGGLDVFFDTQDFDNVSIIFNQQYSDAPADRAVITYPMEAFVESIFNGLPTIDLSSVTFVDVGIRARMVEIIAARVKKRINLVV